ncbi:MAG: hypothetical protein A2Y63_02275 [Candidatus Riflebacteria bacterium RBG_13_59_9]|nr:MAG: hypothetical protein A2Y63_02275 [Candidatus Riflebacteria bacterium RBG_13_59_9]
MVASRNPVHSALFLIANFFALAVIFLLLSAPLLAALEILVYAGAIMVLFLFIIFFFVQPGQKHIYACSLPGQSFFAGVLVLVLVSVLVLGLYFSGVFVPEEHAPVLAARAEELSSPQHLGSALFSRYLLPFELTSLLLLAAMLGAVVLARRERREGDD